MLDIKRIREDFEGVKAGVERRGKGDFGLGKVKDLDVATKVSVQLQLTDTSVKSRDRIVKKTEKDSLYSAIDIATVWLNRALSAR